MKSLQHLKAFQEIQTSVMRVYAEVCNATVPAESWDDAWFMLISLKGHLQSFPDFLEQSMWAAPSENGQDYRITVLTEWRTLDALEVWLTDGWSVERILLSLTPPGRDIDSEVREQVS
jgi:hypothetical protein